MGSKRAISFMSYYDSYNQYHMVNNNCTTFAIETLKYIGIVPPTTPRNWTIPEAVKVWAYTQGIYDFSNYNGYSPGDAGEDIRNTGDYIYIDNAEIKENQYNGKKTK